MLITSPCTYHTEDSIVIHDTVVKALHIHKSNTKVLGIVLHNIEELFASIGLRTPIASNGIFYYPGKQIKIKRISRQITTVTNKRIKVYGSTYFIDHNDSSIRVPTVASKNVYAKLIEWEYMRFFIGYSYDKVPDKNVKI